MFRGVTAGAAALAVLLGGLSPLERAAGQGGAVKVFTVVAERFKFTPNRIEVDEGDTVRVTVKSADNTHGWQVKALDVDLLAKKGGRPETLEFVAAKAGTFPIVCSEYCGKGHEGMKGLLVVHARGER